MGAPPRLTPPAAKLLNLRFMFTRCCTACMALALLGALCCLGARPARASDSGTGQGSRVVSADPCCALLLGAGTTFGTFGRWHWTDGVILPALLEIDDSRWELGAFRFATRQFLKESPFPPSTLGARPYWGFSAMRRWQLLRRSRFKLYLGFGGSYKTETDMLDATRWNFALLMALRYSIGEHALLEASVRHWSNAEIKEPNRGENMLLLTVGFR